jgi:hypothetical protein
MTTVKGRAEASSEKKGMRWLALVARRSPVCWDSREGEMQMARMRMARRVTVPKTAIMAAASGSSGLDSPEKTLPKRMLMRLEMKRRPGETRGSEQPRRTIWIQTARPEAHGLPRRWDSERRHLRQSMTAKVRQRTSWEKMVKTASGKPRPKKRTSGWSCWTVRMAAPAVRGRKPGRFSMTTGMMVRYSK